MRNSLTNEDQRAAFDKIAQGEWDQMHQQIQVHVGKQRVVYDNESTQGALDAKMDQAIKAYNDPTIVEPAIHARASIIQLHGQRNGLPQDFIDTQVAKATSDLRLDVVQQYADNGQGNLAVAYVNQHKDEFVGKALTTAEKLAHTSSVEADGVHYGDVITGVAPAQEGSPVHAATSEPEAYTEAAKIQDPQIREKTEQRISLYYNRQAAATRQTQDAAFQKGYDILLRSGGDLTAVPMSLRHAMGATHGSVLIGESKRLQKADDPGDSEKYMELLNSAYFTPDQFSQENIPGTSGLNDSQKTHLMTLQRSVGGRMDRQQESDIQKRITRADADARHYKGLADKATDEETKTAAQTAQREAEDAAIFARQDLEAHRTKVATPAPASGAVIRGGPASSGATIRGGGQPVAPETGAVVPTTANPVGLTPAVRQAPTPQMLQDIARKGPAYAKYLQHMGIDAPDSVVIPEPEPKKP
jgi:hypothetical protein